MSLDRFFKGSTMDVMASAGTIGLHMVSGPMVGFGIGYALDAWLGTSPWCKLVFFLVGVIAGFMNVYEDTQRLLRKMQREDMARRGLGPDGERLAEPEGDAAHKAAGTQPAGAARDRGTMAGAGAMNEPGVERDPGATGAMSALDVAQTLDAADAAVAATRHLPDAARHASGASVTDPPPVDDDSLEAVLRAEMEDLRRELAAARKGSAENTATIDTATIDPARLVDTTRSRLQ